MAIVANAAQTTLPATVNNSVFNYTALDLLTDALENLRVIDAELPLGDYERKVGFDKLNQLIKWLQAKDFHLWTETEAVLPLIPGQEKYLLGPNGADCANEDDFRFLTVKQDSSNKNLHITGDINAAPELILFDPTNSAQDWVTVDSTVTSDGAVLTVTNTTTSSGSVSYSVPTTVGNTYIFTFGYTKGSSSGVNITAEDINGTISTITLTVSASTTLTFVARQKNTSFKIENISTISGQTSLLSTMNYVDNDQGDRIGVFLNDKTLQWNNVVFFSNDKVTLGDKLLSNTSKGNKVYVYTNIIPRPMSIINVRFRENKGFTDIPTTMWSRKEYFEQPDKSNKGTLTKWYYSPALANGEFYTWSTASSNEQFAYFTYVRPTLINDANSTVPDFPSEWFIPLSAILSKWLIPKFSVPDQKAIEIKELALEAMDEIWGFDNEDSYLAFTPGHVGR